MRASVKSIPSNLTSSNPREIALAVLGNFRRRDTDATRLLHDLLKRGEVRGADARLATELALGILRQRSRLDDTLSKMTRRAWYRTPPIVCDILRLGAYQLMFMDRIPAHAAVNESVELAHRWTTRGQAATVNAILRRLAQEREQELQSADSQPSQVADRETVAVESSDSTRWPVTYSHPPWLISYLLSCYPADEVEAFLEWNNRTPNLMLRTNRLRITAEQLADRLKSESYEVGRIGWPTPESVELRGVVGDVGGAAWFTEGLATVQDGAAQLVVHLLSPRPGERIADWCAGPGGKSSHMAEISDDRARILALDVDANRLAAVALHAQRLGLQSVRTYPLRPELIEWLSQEPADAVLVDAPCTGLGTIQRHPDIRWRRNSKDIERSARLQLEILDAAAHCVRTGGRLIYCACTLGPNENGDVVSQFLERHPQFERVELSYPTDPVVSPFLDERGDLRTWPPKHQIDGFFAARLMRAK